MENATPVLYRVCIVDYEVILVYRYTKQHGDPMRFSPKEYTGVSFRSDTFISKVYGLLSFTIVLSFIGSLYGMAHSNSIGAHPIIMVIALFIILFGVGLLSRISTMAGILGVCGFALFDGVFIGPVISHYLSSPKGSEVVSESLIGTALMFISLSSYALISKRNFSHWRGFLIAGLLTSIVLSIVNIVFFHIPALQTSIAVIVILVFSGLILVDTQRILNSENGDAALIVLSLYLDVMNIFLALLEIFSSEE